MSNRRKFLRNALLSAGIAPAFSLLPAKVRAANQPRPNQPAADLPSPGIPVAERRNAAEPNTGAESRTAAEPSDLSKKLKSLTRNTVWKLADQIKINFRTFHCQGMVKIGDEFWVSSVEVDPPATGTWDRSKGKGHLFKIDSKGNQLADITIGEGAIYHPSGIDYDGKYIWIAAAEYRPDSQAIIYRFEPATQHLKEVFRWEDHIGGVLRDPETNTLHGISWGSRRFYQWQLDSEGKPKLPATGSHRDTAKLNNSFYIDYQDNQYIGGHEVVYTGLNAYKRPDGTRMAIGGIEVVDLRLGLPVHQVPVELWSPSTGTIITQNPSYFEVADQRLRACFMPDDNVSTIYVYETGV